LNKKIIQELKINNDLKALELYLRGVNKKQIEKIINKHRREKND